MFYACKIIGDVFSGNEMYISFHASKIRVIEVLMYLLLCHISVIHDSEKNRNKEFDLSTGVTCKQETKLNTIAIEKHFERPYG